MMDDQSLRSVLQRIKRLEDGVERRRVEVPKSPTIRLAGNYIEATNVFNGALANVGAFGLLSTSIPFTVVETSSIVRISYVGMMQFDHASVGTAVYFTMQIDGSNVAYWGSGINKNANPEMVQLSGSLDFTGLAAGAHTTTLAINVTVNNTTLYLRPVSTPFEQLRGTVLEFRA